MADIELLKRLAYKAQTGLQLQGMGYVAMTVISSDGALQDWQAQRDVNAFAQAANPAAILELMAENEELAERIRLFELIHGGRASELYHQISVLHDEVRRLKIIAGEDVTPLPEEFVGPLPERPYSRLLRKLQAQQKPAGDAGAAENCRCNEKLQVVQELQAELERVRKDAERLDWLLHNASGRVLRAVGIILPANADHDLDRAAVDAAMGEGGRR